MTDGKTTKWKKDGKTNTGHLIFSYTVYLDTVYMYTKFEEAGITRIVRESDYSPASQLFLQGEKNNDR